MTCIQIDDRGFASLQIAMPGGELIDYRADVGEGGAVELHNLASGEHYTVRPQSPRIYHCDCPAWKFRKTRQAPRGCKHCVAVQHLIALVLSYRPLIEPLTETLPMTQLAKLPDDIHAALSAPFDPREVRWKPQSVSGARALAIAYISARTVMDRLDAVFGVGGWQTSYREAKDGVICQLSVRVGEHWCVHEDIGGESEQPDEGDRAKAAFSDSLKRAAIHLGIGRYLYRLPAQWVDYDPKHRQFTRTPSLPDWALPGKKPAPPPAAAPASTPPASPPPSARGPADPPTDGIELEQRLTALDAKAAAAGACAAGALVAHVVDWARQEAGVSGPLPGWPRVVVQSAYAEMLRHAKELSAQKQTA